MNKELALLFGLINMDKYYLDFSIWIILKKGILIQYYNQGFYTILLDLVNYGG